MSRPVKVPITKIVLDGGTQVRTAIDQGVVDDYAERMTAGDVFRAVDLFQDGPRYWMGDGFHRVAASRKLKHTTVSAIVRPGGRAEALWWALAANRNQGLRMSRGDKRNAVEMALKEFPGKADNAIAAQIGVSNHMVAECRAQVGDLQPGEKRQGADGKRYPTGKKPVKTYGNVGDPPSASDRKPMSWVEAAEQGEPAQVGDLQPDKPSIPAPLPPSLPGLPPGGRALQPEQAQARRQQEAAAEAARTGRQVDPETPALYEPRDLVGQVIPDIASIRQAFERRPIIVRMMSAISDIKGAAIRMSAEGDPLMATLSVSQFSADLNNARSALVSTAPYAVCPYCHGGQDGPGRDCKACKGLGWLGKFAYNAVPPALKLGHKPVEDREQA